MCHVSVGYFVFILGGGAAAPHPTTAHMPPDIGDDWWAEGPQRKLRPNKKGTQRKSAHIHVCSHRSNGDVLTNMFDGAAMDTFVFGPWARNKGARTPRMSMLVLCLSVRP